MTQPKQIKREETQVSQVLNAIGLTVEALVLRVSKAYSRVRWHRWDYGCRRTRVGWRETGRQGAKICMHGMVTTSKLAKVPLVTNGCIRKIATSFSWTLQLQPRLLSVA